MSQAFRSACRFLRRPRDEGRRTQYKKICSDDLVGLVTVVERLRAAEGGWKRCGTCYPISTTDSPSVLARNRLLHRSKSLSVGLSSPQTAPAVRNPSSVRAIGSEDFVLWQPRRELARLDIEPHLASWDAKSHPSQQRLQAYLDELEAEFARHLTGSCGRFYVHVEVVRPAGADLLLHHDLENYLTPIAQRLRSGAVVLATAVKRHPENSIDHSWVALGEVVSSASITGWNFRAATVTGSPESSSWKETLRKNLIESNVEEAAIGPLSMVIAWRQSAVRRSWWNAWKPTGDALGPILGEPRSGKPFNPADDRIVRLEMHLSEAPAPTAETQVGVWWKLATANE